MRRLALLLLLLSLVAACSGTHTSDHLHPFPAAVAGVPVDWHQELCSASGFTVRFAVPRSRATGQQTAHACLWDAGYGGLSVDLRPQGTLADYKRTSLDRYEEGGGDDSVERIHLDEDAPVFGDQRGQRLDWYCACDGSPVAEHMLQAGGLRVSWSSPVPDAADLRDDEGLQRFLESVSVEAGERDQCRDGDDTVTYVLPAMVDSVDSVRGTCHAYLLKGLTSEDHFDVVVTPSGTLEGLAASLRGRPHVAGIRLEPGAVRLAGRPVDRLTWSVPGRWRMTAVGDSRVRITWAATPRQWDEERTTLQRFLASVRLP